MLILLHGFDHVSFIISLVIGLIIKIVNESLFKKKTKNAFSKFKFCFSSTLLFGDNSSLDMFPV